MSIPVRSLRLLPKSKTELDRISGNKGEIFYDSTSKSLRIFDGTILGGTLLNASVSVKETAPDNPTQGSLWFNSATGAFYIYYEDGTSNQWIAPIVPAGLIGGGGGGGGGSGSVLTGAAGKLAYYPAAGTSVDDLTELSWASNQLSVTGTLNVSGQKNYIRFHWDTLADLTNEVNPTTWHGMLAHVHDTGRVYFAHAGAWVPLATQADVSGAGLASFGTIAVAGQSNVVADQSNDTFTLVAGSNITITTNATNDSITISSTGGGGGGGGPAFGTISVAGQSDLVAEQINDILTVVAGTGLSITTTPGSDTLTISNTGISNSFATIVTPGPTTLLAENSNTTLTFAAGTGINISGNATNDTITISSGFNQSLNSTDNVIFNSVTAATLQSIGTGTPTYTSGSDFIFNTGGGAGALILNGDIEVSGSATLGNVGVANGIASLGSDGKLSANQIPSSLTGAVVFKGTWNASTNTPTLADGVGTAGWQYAVSVGGTINLGSGNITFVAGDNVIYNGTIWQRIPASTVAAAGTLTGTTLASNVVSSSLTSVGVLTNLSVTNTITGSISGNAGSVTNGVYTNVSYADPSWITSLAASKVGLGNVTNESKATMFTSPTFTGTVTLLNEYHQGAGTNADLGGDVVFGIKTQNNGYVAAIQSDTGIAGLKVVGTGAGFGIISAEGNSTISLVSPDSTNGGGLEADRGTLNIRGAQKALDGSIVAQDIVLYTNYNQTALTVAGSNRSVTIHSTTASTSTSTGALKVAGGLGVAGAIYAGNIFSNGLQVGGATVFSGLTDTNAASLTVDKIYLPAITMLAVTNNGASSYSFDQYASTNPTIFAINGTTIAFNLNVAGHPFLIQTSGGVNYNTGLVHVSTSGTVVTGASAQGQTSGTLYWKIPTGISGNYRYICQLHGVMVGTITIKDMAAI